MTLKILILTCFKQNLIKNFLIDYGEGGIRTSTKVTSCNSLAGSRFQPLSHLSSSYTLSIFLQTFKIFYLIEMSSQHEL